MVRSGFDIESDLYKDITTGRLYEPKLYCELCGISHWNARLEVHHYLPQQKCMRDKKSKIDAPYIWTRKFINKNQKLFTVCRECHTKIHNCTSPKTVINGRRPYDYLWHKEKTEVVTKPKAFVVKKGELQ